MSSCLSPLGRGESRALSSRGEETRALRNSFPGRGDFPCSGMRLRPNLGATSRNCDASWAGLAEIGSTLIIQALLAGRDGMIRTWFGFGLGVVFASTLAVTAAEARVVSLEVQRHEPILNGKQFGGAGAYEKLVGKVHFALDPKAAINQRIVDLNLAPKNAQGEVEFTADFFMLKPADPKKGNHRLFYEVGNRGGKSMLRYFQKAKNAKDPASAEETGDGALMNQGWTLLWMGWQWDVPPGQMRMEQPIATDNGKTITGLVRGNFVP